jgi:hypothetical protein
MIRQHNQGARRNQRNDNSRQRCIRSDRSWFTGIRKMESESRVMSYVQVVNESWWVMVMGRYEQNCDFAGCNRPAIGKIRVLIGSNVNHPVWSAYRTFRCWELTSRPKPREEPRSKSRRRNLFLFFLFLLLVPRISYSSPSQSPFFTTSFCPS